MKGCIIKNDEISIKDICNIIGDVDNYNWLITNIECYPSDEEIVKIWIMNTVGLKEEAC